MGAKQFSDVLCIQHLKYDELQLQYLEVITQCHQHLGEWGCIEYEDFLPFEDTSPTGYHGFVPGAQWI